MRSDISLEMYEEMIDTFMPSRCMNEFLKYGEVIIDKETLICELILYSSVSLKTKAIWLNKLREICINSSEGHYAKVYQVVNKALILLEQSHSDNLIWVVEDCWYDYDIREQKAVFVGACDSYENMINFIKNERAEELEYSEDGEPGENWFRISLMQRDEEIGKYDFIYRFYEINEEICFFEDMQFYGKGKSKQYRIDNYPFDYTFPLRPSLGFNPPKPFKSGDILEINYGPFAPKLNVVVLEIDEDHNDDSYPVVLVRNQISKKEYWDVASLQGTLPNVAYGFANVMSPLFLVAKKADLSAYNVDDEILTQVSELIKRNNSLGKELWNDINADGMYPFTGDEIRKWIKEHQARYIVDMVAKHYGVPYEKIISKGATAEVLRPRQVAIYLCKGVMKMSFREIGNFFDGRDSHLVLGIYLDVERAFADDLETLSSFKKQLEWMKAVY